MAAHNLTRRWVLAGLGAGLAAPALGAAQSAPSTADLVAKANLTGTTGFCVADVATGKILDSFNPLAPVPPASVIKAITTLYALDRLGADHQFTTQVLATQPVNAGTLAGDLILSGGGDPTLNTDNLGDMVAALAINPHYEPALLTRATIHRRLGVPPFSWPSGTHGKPLM